MTSKRFPIFFSFLLARGRFVVYQKYLYIYKVEQNLNSNFLDLTLVLKYKQKSLVFYCGYLKSGEG